MRCPSRSPAWLLAVVAWSVTDVAGARADDELLTDRPDFTETTVAVSPGRFQIEAGFTSSRETGGAGGGATHAFNAPEALLRVGWLRGMELRLGFDSRFARDVASLGEGYAGLKLEVAPESGPVGLALIPAVTGPIWKDDSDEPATGAEVVLAWARSLPEPWSVGGIVGWTFAEDDAVGGTVSVARALGDRWGTFIEWAGERAGGEGSHLVHHGYTLGLGPDVQLDAHVGFGLGEQALNWFAGAGLAIRR